MILSVVLHCVLLSILFWNLIQRPQERVAGISGSAIDVVMVDLAAVQQYNRQQQTEEEKQKQAGEQHGLTFLRKSRLVTQEMAGVKQNKLRQQKQVVTKKHTVAQENTSSDAKTKTAQTGEGKAVAKSKKKVIAQVAKRSEVEDLLRSLTDPQNVLKLRAESQFNRVSFDTSKSKQNAVSVAEINAYKAMVSRAISSKFYDPSIYSGKTCDLYLTLAPDGMLISVSATRGDPALCQAAIAATKLAMIPKAFSPQVYEVFKYLTLEFAPQ